MNGLYKVVNWLSIAAKMYDLELTRARFEVIDSLYAAKWRNTMGAPGRGKQEGIVGEEGRVREKEKDRGEGKGDKGKEAMGEEK